MRRRDGHAALVRRPGGAGAQPPGRGPRRGRLVRVRQSPEDDRQGAVVRRRRLLGVGAIAWTVAPSNPRRPKCPTAASRILARVAGLRSSFAMPVQPTRPCAMRTAAAPATPGPFPAPSFGNASSRLPTPSLPPESLRLARTCRFVGDPPRALQSTGAIRLVVLFVSLPHVGTRSLATPLPEAHAHLRFPAQSGQPETPPSRVVVSGAAAGSAMAVSAGRS